MPLRNLWNSRAGHLITRSSLCLVTDFLDTEASFFSVGTVAVNPECLSDVVVKVRWQELRGVGRRGYREVLSSQVRGIMSG
jgi:hypothetical protein